jgi:hypothetical protein
MVRQCRATALTVRGPETGVDEYPEVASAEVEPATSDRGRETTQSGREAALAGTPVNR